MPLSRLAILTALIAVFSITIATSGRAQSAQVSPDHKTQHIIFIMTDGLRWQEVFHGPEELLMNKQNGKVKNEAELRKTYWRATEDERREALMPFVWQVIAKQGQIFGNRDKGSDAYVTNHMFFSYPGYNETLCGFPDDERIHSNDNVPNPNVTVLEWLKNRPGFGENGDIAAFGAWDVIGNVFNPERSYLTANAGYVPLALSPSTPELDLVNRFKLETPRIWGDEPFDAVPFYTAVEYMKLKHPHVLYVSLGETDDWAHGGQYKEYLDSTHRVDSYLRAIWGLAQSLPEYQGTTTLIFSPDHGRGKAPKKWRDHGQKIPDSKYIWMMFLGPDTQPLGERTKIVPVTQSQIAATLAAFLGQDYDSSVTKAGKPITDVLPH